MSEITTDECESEPLTGRHLPSLRLVFSIAAEVDEHLPLLGRDTEPLDFIPIVGGSVTGDVYGDVLPGGGDWCLNRSDECYEVDAHYAIRTHDGEHIDVRNTGVLRHQTGDTEGPTGMSYFMTTPTFRAAAPRLQWLTRSVFIGQARVRTGVTVIDVFEVLAGSPIDTAGGCVAEDGSR